jgi:hypothetical protein
VVWRRGGAAESSALPVPVPGLAGGAPEVLFPAGAGVAAGWRAEAELVVTLPRAPSACLIRLPSGG